jgi:hypothetical protein
LLPGTVSVEGFESDTDAGFMLLGKLEAIVAEKLGVGGQVLLAFPNAGDESATLMNLGMILKLRLGSPKFQVRPGVAFSYQRISGDYIEDAIQGYSPGAFVELAFPFTQKMWGVPEVGFISQPDGGNDDVEVTFAPNFYLAFGVEFDG